MPCAPAGRAGLGSLMGALALLALCPAPVAWAGPPGGGGGLWESPRERDQRLLAEREASLAESLEWLPSVRKARVHLGTGTDDRTPSRAAVLLEPEGAALPDGTRARARELVRAAIPSLALEHIEVAATPARRPSTGAAAAAPALVRVGPFHVVPSDAPGLRALLALLLGLNGALSLALIGLWRRHRAGARPTQGGGHRDASR